MSAMVARQLVDAVRALATERRMPEVGTATVQRADPDGTVWVRLPGADADTPVNGTVTASAEPGQLVAYRIDGGRLSVTGNATSPAVGGTYVAQAVAPVDAKADAALADAARASSAADQAELDAQRANEAANEAVEDAATANAAAQQAQADAATANAAAQQAQADATAAGTAASAAQASATRANTAANDALTQLSTVQDVVGTVEWAATHSEQDMAAYISSHLALTDAGLWVVKDAQGYRLLAANDGVRVVDPQGHIVTTFGESISFNSSRPQSIGGEDAYIVYYYFDNDGVPDSISIGGDNVTIGGSGLSQVLADVAQASTDAQQALDACTIALTSTNGTVFKQNTGVSTSIIATVFTADGLRIESGAALRSRYGAGARLQWRWKDSGATDFTTLLDDDPRISGGGFVLTVSPSDISTQAVIDCQLVY